MKIDRRRFLLGTGGAVLALPVLESLLGQHAQAQPTPKRLVVMFFSQGLVRTRWMPPEGPLPESGNLSDLLAPLNRVRDKILVLSGIGNPMRHRRQGDNHQRTNTTILTNATPQTDSLAGGQSIDQAAAQVLSRENQRRSALFRVSYNHAQFNFFEEDRGVVSPVSGLPQSPREAAETLFGCLPPNPGSGAGNASLRDRLRGRRGTLIDAVTENLAFLRRQLSAADARRLDAHAEHLHALARRFDAGVPAPSEGCSPNCSAFPDVANEWNGQWIDRDGLHDNIIAPAQIEMIRLALSCDVTRVASLYFNAAQGNSFPWLFNGSITACTAGFLDWHDMIHNGQPTGSNADAGVPNLIRGQTFYMEQLADLISALDATPDHLGPGSLLDNTLVLCMSDFGDENHGTYNIPVIMAGLRNELGPGRHLAVPGRTIGDLFATVLELLGGPPGSTLGETGPLDWTRMHDTWAWNGSTPPGYFTQGVLPI